MIIHKPGKQVSTLKAYVIMRLSSFAYRITTQDWENLSALHSSHFYYLNFAVYVWANQLNQTARELLLTDKPIAVCTIFSEYIPVLCRPVVVLCWPVAVLCRPVAVLCRPDVVLWDQMRSFVDQTRSFVDQLRSTLEEDSVLSVQYFPKLYKPMFLLLLY